MRTVKPNEKGLFERRFHCLDQESSRSA